MPNMANIKSKEVTIDIAIIVERQSVVYVGNNGW
jgi:hypothetical protein